MEPEIKGRATVATATATIAAPAPDVATATQVVALPNPATVGQPVTFTAFVSSQGGGEPTGFVTFLIDGAPQPLVPVSLIDGSVQASLTLTLDAGFHSVVALYRGAPGLRPSTSNFFGLNVLPVPTPTPTPEVNGPTVLSVQRFGFHSQPTSLILNFNADLDPARATNPSNYLLIARGRDGRFGTRDDRLVRFRRVEHNPFARSVILRPASRLPLRNIYLLDVRGSAGGLADLAGRALDGDRDGRPGGDFTVVINRRLLVGPNSAARRLAPLLDWRRVHANRR